MMRGAMDQMVERFGRFFPAGTVLFREGEPGAEMYVIHSGRVELTRQLKDRTSVIAVLPAGEFFGEMAIVNQRPRSATATVTEDSWLLVIDARTFESMIRTRSEIAVRLIRTLAGRLEQANEQIELLLVKDLNHRVVLCLRSMAEQRGVRMGEGMAVFIPLSLPALAGRVALGVEEVKEILEKLKAAKLVRTAYDSGLDEEGFVVPEVGRLVDFLEFLELKERFATD